MNFPHLRCHGPTGTAGRRVHWALSLVDRQGDAISRSGVDGMAIRTFPVQGVPVITDRRAFIVETARRPSPPHAPALVRSEFRQFPYGVSAMPSRSGRWISMAPPPLQVMRATSASFFVTMIPSSGDRRSSKIA